MGVNYIPHNATRFCDPQSNGLGCSVFPHRVRFLQEVELRNDDPKMSHPHDEASVMENNIRGHFDIEQGAKCAKSFIQEKQQIVQELTSRLQSRQSLLI